MIGQTTEDIQVSVFSYPEITDVSWTNGQNTYNISTDRYTARNITINNGGFSYYQTYTLNILKLSETDIGDFSLKYRYDGKDFEEPASRLIQGNLTILVVVESKIASNNKSVI